MRALSACATSGSVVETAAVVAGVAAVPGVDAAAGAALAAGGVFARASSAPLHAALAMSRTVATAMRRSKFIGRCTVMESVAREIMAELCESQLRRGKIPHRRLARLRCRLGDDYYGAYVLHPRSPESRLRSRRCSSMTTGQLVSVPSCRGLC